MHPNHTPLLQEAINPAALERFDGRATRAITRQQEDLVEKIGNFEEAIIPGLEGEPAEPLYGYNIPLTNGTEITLPLSYNAAGVLDPQDQHFVDTRNRLAILRSRERSRGSRRFNFAFMKDRGAGDGGHGYKRNTPPGGTPNGNSIQEQYDEALSDFISRKIVAHGGLVTAPLVHEAVSKTVIQEQKQMGALESMAAELRSGARFLNFMRNHKKSRFAVGVLLSGIGILGVATGQPEIFIPALALRSALSATGGYLIGRTAWDAVQGRQAEHLRHNDIRMVSHRNGDFSGRLRPRAGFERMVKLQGAEARAGSHQPLRRKLIGELSADLVHRYYTSELSFAAGHDGAAIKTQVLDLHQRVINPLQEKRLESDQTQSRNRNRAGFIGGVILGSVPFLKPLGILDLDGIFGGDGHTASGVAAIKPHIPSANVGGGNGGSGAGTGNMSGNYSGGGGGSMSGNPSGGAGSPAGSAGGASSGGIPNPGQNGGGNGNYGGQYGQSGAAGSTTGNGAHFERIRGNELTKLVGDPTDPHRIQLVHGPRGADGSPGFVSLQTADGQVEVDHLSLGPDGLTSDSVQRLNNAGIKTVLDHTGDGGRGRLDIFAQSTTGNSGSLPMPQSGAAAPNMINPGSGGSQNGAPTIYNWFFGGAPGTSYNGIAMPAPDSAAGKALQGIMNGNYVPDSSMGGLTPDQAVQAQSLIADLAQNPDLSHLSPTDQTIMEHYIQTSIDHPRPLKAAQDAATRINILWQHLAHDLTHAAPVDIENLEDDLAIVNVGRVHA